MNLNINELIAEHGPDIASQLKIATEQLYDKLIWYIRVDGIVNLIKAGLFIVPISIWIIAFRWWVKNKDIDEESKFFGGLFIFIIGGLLYFALFGQFISFLTTSLSMIVAPEYYLINQIIENIGK